MPLAGLFKTRQRMLRNFIHLVSTPPTTHGSAGIIAQVLGNNAPMRRIFKNVLDPAESTADLGDEIMLRYSFEDVPYEETFAGG